MYLQKPSTPILVAIIVALLLVGFALWRNLQNPSPEQILKATHSELLRAVRAAQPDDHIYGNPNALIFLIVYTDLACPFCKQYHDTVKTIIDTYGKDGSVALIYRNIPFVQLHPEAPLYAHAGECIASLGSNAAYWKFVDTFFAQYLDTQKPNADSLVAFAGEAGVSSDAFRACMRSNAHMGRVERDYKEAVDIGARASPFTVIIEPDVRRSFEGTRSYVELAAAVISSIQTLQATGVLEITERSGTTIFPED